MIRHLVVLAILLAAPHAQAQDPSGDTLTIRAKPNDTLALLAAEYYGDRNRAIFIMVANKIAHPRPLKVGERLKIPMSRQVIAAPGDTFETLAAAYLGNALRGTFLADFNNMSLDDGLASGTTLSIPFTVTHTATATESIASIAAAYFGDTKSADLLRRYNFLERDSIDKGEQLIVPIFNVRLAASKMPSIDAESRARRERQQSVQARAARVLPAARQAWRAGDFAEVKSVLAEVELYLDYLDTTQAVEVGVLLGSLHLAYSDTKPALEAFKRVLERKPTHQLDRYQYSPKVIDAWKEAGGTVAP